MQVHQIRQQFLDYFASIGHTIVKSSSLIPHEDPTLLFTNAGMNQFKDVFLGLDKRDYVRAVSSQKCVRAGGKHNDLENVGYTARHHTFFEMLGNFSFGDYFKLDAIKFAWEFLTDVLKLPQNKLYVTVYKTDDEAFEIWHKVIGLATDRIIRIGDKSGGGSDNFWQMGETGPCGPCTEIFYDHGDSIWGGLPGTPDEDGDRFIEIWNCVFMQFNRDDKGVLHPLPKPSVDTGMGLERISAVMQHVHSNYEIDLFVELIKSAAKITNCNDLNNSSLKVLADHIRSVSFLIADGAIPSNEGRGYVLRRIIRRAIRHGYKLGQRTAFLHKLVNELVKQMGGAYPELKQHQPKIENTILQEEKNFFLTIENGMELLLGELKKLQADTSKILSGDVAFKLYDTYGFPLDLTEDVCREHSILVDITGFDIGMQKQKDMAKAAGKFKAGTSLEYTGCETGFIGYSENNIEAHVVALYCNNEPVNQLKAGDSGIIVLDQTVFYAESGGQVGDVGIIQIDGGATLLFNITDTQKIRPAVFGHIGNVVNGTLKVGDTINATYDLHKRMATARNHSVTHLLHKALHEVVGEHATQKGSLVCSDYTRFDFANDKPVTKSQIEEIERIVNHVIMMNYPVTTKLMHYEDAIKHGAMALFGEKYANDVRVIQMGEFSTELCGGTHVSRTGDIGFFSITSEAGVANGVRRIEAITGEVALARMQANMIILDNLREELKAQSNDIILDKVDVLQRDNKLLMKQINELKSKIAVLQAHQYLSRAETLAGGNKLLVLELNEMDNKVMVDLVEELKNKLGNAIVVVGARNGDRVSLVVGVTKDISAKYKAGNIINYLATQVGGKGGGRPDLAQAGGSDIANLSNALSSTRDFIESI
jgi:alanyl-tRNA synthetase